MPCFTFLFILRCLRQLAHTLCWFVVPAVLLSWDDEQVECSCKKTCPYGRGPVLFSYSSKDLVSSFEVGFFDTFIEHGTALLPCRKHCRRRWRAFPPPKQLLAPLPSRLFNQLPRHGVLWTNWRNSLLLPVARNTFVTSLFAIIHSYRQSAPIGTNVTV